MAKKYKVTGCAKFFFVLLLLAPLAFIGASYYNGQNPFETINGIFGGDGEAPREATVQTSELEDRNRKLEKDIRFYKREKERLEKELQDCQTASSGG